MPAATTTNDFLTNLRQSGLLDEQRLQGFIRQHQASASLPDEPQQLASLLVRASLLSRFQAEQLLRGKARGFIIKEKYKVLELAGTGGMGNVFLCEHLFLRSPVALKLLRLGNVKPNTSIIERFHREARASATLNHPNIVHASDFDRDEKQLFLAMDYVDGVNMHELVKVHGPMDHRRVADTIVQAAAGLQYAHEAGWVHRDIKPGNLLLDRRGVVRLLDMGLARLFHDESDRITKIYDEKSVLGTADFLAPEQAWDSHEVDIRADIYGLGATAYYLLTGQLPFPQASLALKFQAIEKQSPKPISDYRPEVPHELIAVIDKMMAKDRKDRYQVPVEVIEALAPWTDSPVPLPPEKEMPRHCPLVAELLGRAMVKTAGPPASGRLPRNKSAPPFQGPDTVRDSGPETVPIGRRHVGLGWWVAALVIGVGLLAGVAYLIWKK